MRLLKFGRWGLMENPIGAHVVTNDGKLREVVAVYHREHPRAVMLTVRSFNREIVEEVSASSVKVLERDVEGESNG